MICCTRVIIDHVNKWLFEVNQRRFQLYSGVKFALDFQITLDFLLHGVQVNMQELLRELNEDLSSSYLCLTSDASMVLNINVIVTY